MYTWIVTHGGADLVIFDFINRENDSRFGFSMNAHRFRSFIDALADGNIDGAVLALNQQRVTVAMFQAIDRVANGREVKEPDNDDEKAEEVDGILIDLKGQ